MKLAVRFIYYKAVTPSMDIVTLTLDEWHEFYQMKDPLQRRDFMINRLGRKYLLGKVRELCWIPLNHQTKLAVTDHVMTVDEWRQHVRDEIKLITSNLTKEDWKEIEDDLRQVTEDTVRCYDWREAAWNMLL